MDTQTPDPVPAADPGLTPLPADSPWWARWMVANWREVYRWASAWFAAAGVMAAELYAQDPALFDAIPVSWRPHIAAAAFVVSILLRLKRQLPKDPK